MHLRTVLKKLGWRPETNKGISILDSLKVRTVSTSYVFCDVLTVESLGVGVVLLGSGDSLGSLARNLGL